MLNKKASIGDFLKENVVYIILLVMFVIGMFAFVYQKKDNAGFWEEYYAKEIAKVIELSEPGDEIVLDVQKITEIASANDVKDLKSIFVFKKNEVCVKLNAGDYMSCYKYLNEVIVDSPQIISAKPINKLEFKIKEKER